jgi:hypothetical protein
MCPEKRTKPEMDLTDRRRRGIAREAWQGFERGRGGRISGQASLHQH